MTDDKQMSKVDRKKFQVEHAPQISKKAKMVKMADKLYNLNDLLNNPPANWSAEQIQGYFTWVTK